MSSFVLKIKSKCLKVAQKGPSGPAPAHFNNVMSFPVSSRLHILFPLPQTLLFPPLAW